MASLPANAKQIWTELLAVGATPIQAAGIMGNMFQESGMNPESSAVDTNGKLSVGLVSWNNNPTAQTLLTGNPSADIKSQIMYLATSGGIQATNPASDPSTAAVNFQNNYEKCDPSACDTSTRTSMAGTVYAAAQSGNWASTPGNLATLTQYQYPGDAGPSAPGQPQTASDTGCAININALVANYCIWKNSWTHGLIGGIALVGGVVVVAFGALLVVGLPTSGLKKQTVGRLGGLGGAGQQVQVQSEEFIRAREDERQRRRSIAQAHRAQTNPDEGLEARAIRREQNRQTARRAVEDFRRSQRGPQRNPSGVGSPKRTGSGVPKIPKIPIE